MTDNVSYNSRSTYLELCTGSIPNAYRPETLLLAVQCSKYQNYMKQENQEIKYEYNCQVTGSHG
jgi:hypothetical protein